MPLALWSAYTQEPPGGAWASSILTSVEDFANRFQALPCHASGISARQRVELFVGDLPDHILMDVEMRGPQDLQTAMYYARAFEHRTMAI